MGVLYVYIVRPSDGSYYVGHTRALDERLQAHNQGKAARYTFSRRPVTLVYSKAAESERGAVRREVQIKKWTRAKKEALIDEGTERLKSLSKSGH